jgi:hypothetical protein
MFVAHSMAFWRIWMPETSQEYLTNTNAILNDIHMNTPSTKFLQYLLLESTSAYLAKRVAYLIAYRGCEDLCAAAFRNRDGIVVYSHLELACITLPVRLVMSKTLNHGPTSH